MTVLEIFAGAGGAALGLHRAGLRALAHVEWDHDACDTLRAAVAAGMLGGEVIEGDVRTVDYAPFVGVDLLWGSPPCQAWSSAGKRLGAADERNGWPWTFDVVDRVRPTWALFENVPGMTHHRGECRCPHGDPTDCPAGYFHRIVLPELGRRFAQVEWTILDAADYGVPQHRQRVFIACGPAPLRWPVATHGPPGAHALFGGLRPWRTVREALGLDGALSPVEPRVPAFECLISGAESPSRAAPLASRAERRRGFGGRMIAPFSVAIDAKHPPAVPDEPCPTVRSGGAQTLWLRTEMTGASAWPDTDPSPTLGQKGNTYVHERDPGVRAGSRPELLDAPSPAMCAGDGGKGCGQWSASASTRSACEQATGIRRLSVAECASIQAFPPDWPWQGTQTSRYRQVGNAVPPPMAEALGLAVLAAHESAARIPPPALAPAMGSR